jgi:hypothetical protein
MTVSPAVLLIALTIGVPLMLLALGVLYHAYLFGRQPVDALEQHVDALATESAEELLLALQDAVDEMQQQLAHQRETLAGMLSEQRPMLATLADRPMAAGEFVPQSDARSGGADREHTSGEPAQDIRGRIAFLAEDGLSDRAIARELHIGLEEVRIARMRGQSPKGLRS